MMRKTNSVVRQALGFGFLCVAVFALMGAGSDPAARFHDLGHQMMCICGCGQILLECNHVGCPDSDGMRNELMAAVTRGDSDSLVEQAFVQKYGPTVLAAPTTAGFDRTAYIVPFVALFFGAGLVILIVRAWKIRPAPALADGIPPARHAELEKFREQAQKETEL
jgi:cytochrome c-type biogenesis protein CcmH/NrfF